MARGCPAAATRAPRRRAGHGGKRPVETASGNLVTMRALGPPQQGRDFRAVWVCTEDGFSRAERAGEEQGVALAVHRYSRRTVKRGPPVSRMKECDRAPGAEGHADDLPLSKSQPSGGGFVSSTARSARNPAALPALTEYSGAPGSVSARNRPRLRA